MFALRWMVKLFRKNSNLCDHNPPTLQTDGRTDGWTDRQTTCDRQTALCTKVHRAVKVLIILYILLSADSNVRGLLQGEHPEILAQSDQPLLI